MIHRHLVITGRVQNVFYRDWLVGQARTLGIDGWVRNRTDGSVEAVVQGPPHSVKAMIERAHDGSPASRVETIIVSEAPEEIFDGFERRPTA